MRPVGSLCGYGLVMWMLLEEMEKDGRGRGPRET